MEILKRYRYFLNEASDNSTELKSLADVPKEVLTGVKKIIQGIYEKSSKPRFEVTNKGLIYSFIVTPTDFQFINYDEVLTLEDSQKKGIPYDIRLKINDAVTETFEVSYAIEFSQKGFTSLPEVDDEYDDEYPEEIIDDDIDDEDDEFDEDVLDNNIKKYKIKGKNNHDFNDQLDVDDDEDDDEYF